MCAAASTGCRAVLLLRGRLSVTASTSTSFPDHRRQIFSFINGDFRKKITAAPSYSVRAGLDPPDLLRLAETARISLTPNEVEEFAPKIEQVLDWFGQLQDVDLESIEPSIRAETEGDSLRDDLPRTFENRESIIAAIPSYEEPYIKVPKVLNKE